jgi:hypothetical protein
MYVIVKWKGEVNEEEYCEAMKLEKKMNNLMIKLCDAR